MEHEREKMDNYNSTSREGGQMAAVFGSSGHTGQFIITELLRRGLTPIAIARNSTRLAALLPADGKETKFHLNDLNTSQIILKIRNNIT